MDITKDDQNYRADGRMMHREPAKRMAALLDELNLLLREERSPVTPQR